MEYFATIQLFTYFKCMDSCDFVYIESSVTDTISEYL